MPELPEIATLAHQLDQRLAGKAIAAIEILQPKCLNLEPATFQSALTGATVRSASYRGKWILVDTSQGWLLLNLGMGGELLLVTRDTLPEKRRLIFDFTDSACLCVNFWWFGYAHYAPPDGLAGHEMVGKLGPNALDVSLDDLRGMLRGARGGIKAFLLDQARIAGIGNAYIHDILFLARLHPLRRIDSLSDAEIAALHQAIQDGLRPSLEKGGASTRWTPTGRKAASPSTRSWSVTAKASPALIAAPPS